MRLKKAVAIILFVMFIVISVAMAGTKPKPKPKPVNLPSGLSGAGTTTSDGGWELLK
jgi:hypothetical protein